MAGDDVLEVPGFGSSVLQCLYSQQQTGRFCDVQVKTATGFVPVHRSVMFAAANALGEQCPNWFGEMNRDINMIDSFAPYSQDLVEKFILLLYTGKIVVSDEDFNNLKRIAVKLRLSKLLQMLLAFKSIKQYRKQFNDLCYNPTYCSQEDTNSNPGRDLKRKNNVYDGPPPKRVIQPFKYPLLDDDTTSTCDTQEADEENDTKSHHLCKKDLPKSKKSRRTVAGSSDVGNREINTRVGGTNSAHIPLDDIDSNCIDDTNQQSLSVVSYMCELTTLSNHTKEVGEGVSEGDSLPESINNRTVFIGPSVKEELIDNDFVKMELPNVGRDESDEEEETEMVSNEEFESVKHESCVADNDVVSTMDSTLKQSGRSCSSSCSEMAVPRYLVKNMSSPMLPRFSNSTSPVTAPNENVKAAMAGGKMSKASKMFCDSEGSSNPEKDPLEREVSVRAIDCVGNLLRKTFKLSKCRIQKKTLQPNFTHDPISENRNSLESDCSKTSTLILNKKLIHLSGAREKLLLPLKCKKTKKYPPMVLKGLPEVVYTRKKSARKSKYLSQPVIETIQLDADFDIDKNQAFPEETAQDQHEKNVCSLQWQAERKNLFHTKACSVVLEPLEPDISLELKSSHTVRVKREIS